MKTSWKPLGRSLLIAQRKHVQQSLRGRERVEDDGLSHHPKDVTADENVKVVHTRLMCDRKRDLQSIASQVDIRFGKVQ